MSPPILPPTWRPGPVRVPPDLWRRAGMLGAARARTHAPNRPHEVRVHTLGLAGELVVLGLIETTGAHTIAAAMVERIITLDGDAPDVRYEQGGRCVAADVKVLDPGPRTTSFNVNARKHRALAGHSAGYLPLLLPYGGDAGWRCAAIPHAAVDAWPVCPGPYGAPFHRLPLADFLAAYGGALATVARMMTWAARVRAA